MSVQNLSSWCSIGRSSKNRLTFDEVPGDMKVIVTSKNKVTTQVPKQESNQLETKVVLQLQSRFNKNTDNTILELVKAATLSSS